MVPERAGMVRVIEQVKRPDSPWNSVTPAKKLQGGVGVPDRRKVFRRPWTTWSPPSTWALSHMRNASAAAAGLPARCCLSTDEVRKLPDPILKQSDTIAANWLSSVSTEDVAASTAASA